MPIIDYIPAATAAAAGLGVSPSSDKNSLTFAVTGTLAAGEEIAIEYQDAAGNWQALVENGVPVVLSADNNMVSTDKPAIYRANKPITAAAAGVTVYR